MNQPDQPPTPQQSATPTPDYEVVIPVLIETARKRGCENDGEVIGFLAAWLSKNNSELTAARAEAQRNQDGIRQIEDIVGRHISNPGLESNAVEMVAKLADNLAASRAEVERLKNTVEVCVPALERRTAQLQAKEQELAEARKNYLDLADAVCRSSTSVQDACQQARDTRQQLTASKARESEALARDARSSSTIAGLTKELETEKRDLVELRRLLDDRNGLIHQIRSWLREAGFPDRVKWGEDLHGNEEWVQIKVECQLRDALKQLAEANARDAQSQETIAGLREALDVLLVPYIDACKNGLPSGVYVQRFRFENAQQAIAQLPPLNLPAVVQGAEQHGFPFQCKHCGHRPTPQCVIEKRGDCEKCGDTVIAYTVDAAECIARLLNAQPGATAVDDTKRLDAVEHAGNRILGWKVEWTQTGDMALQIRQTIHESDGLREAIDRFVSQTGAAR